MQFPLQVKTTAIARLFCFASIFAALAPLRAQKIIGDLALADTTAIHALSLRHGQGMLRGRVLYLDGKEIGLLFQGDTLRIPAQAVRTIATVSSRRVRRAHAHATAHHHFLSPSAMPMPAGTGYYRNVMVLYNEVGLQLGARWSGSISTIGFWVGTLFSVQYSMPLAPGVHAALRARLGTVWPLPSQALSYSFTPLLTLGDRRNYLSFGMQYVRMGPEFSDQHQPLRDLQFLASATLSTGQFNRWHIEIVNAQIVNLAWTRYKNRNEFGLGLSNAFRLLPAHIFFPSDERAAWVPLPLASYQRYF